MSDQSDRTEPIATSAPTGPPEPPAATHPGVPTAPPVYAPAEPVAAPSARRGFGLPVLASAAAGALIVGGLVGGFIGYAAHDDSPGFDRSGFRTGDGQGFRQGQQGGPGNGMPQPPNGQAPNGQAPNGQQGGSAG